MTLAIRLTPETEKKLALLAKETGKSKSWYARVAIDEYLEEREDIQLALHRLKKEKGENSLREARKKLGLAD
ncbi:MAG: ribbon-helix-helix protein, CopG family [Gammaproteobacteria bacterium]|nr:ribbon-helix-helix protein, CopG family [Gammaproteobacteria bacterium]